MLGSLYVVHDGKVEPQSHENRPCSLFDPGEMLPANSNSQRVKAPGVHRCYFSHLVADRFVSSHLWNECAE